MKPILLQGFRPPPPTHPCNGPNPPAWCGTGVPIDGGIWLLLLAACLLGIYFIWKRIKNKAIKNHPKL
jgi:hypothetical protein